MNKNIYTIKKGEKQNILIRFKNRDEDKPIDLSNSIVKVQIKDELKDEFNIIEKVITTTSDAYEIGRILDPEKGEIVFRFTDEDYDKLVCERIYFVIIWWEVPEQDFAKVVSSNGSETFMLKVCYP